MSRSFAEVGVPILPARLRQIAAGGAFANGELTQVQFALIATEIQRERRHTKFERVRWRCIRWLLVVGLVLAALNLLITILYVVFSLTHQLSPY
jgi:multisubunit Na+/H+ antiporter MnhB subunit